MSGSGGHTLHPATAREIYPSEVVQDGLVGAEVGSSVIEERPQLAQGLASIHRPSIPQFDEKQRQTLRSTDQ